MSIPLARQTALDELLRDNWLSDITWLSQVDSTNLEAKRRLRDPKYLPTFAAGPVLIVADAQTQGRGRGDHQWWSPDGCLMLTLVINRTSAPASPSAWPQLGLACGVAVAETAASLLDDERSRYPNVSVHLKWPNDVYLQHPGGAARKVAGVLIETQHDSAGQICWLIGIGLNVDVNWNEASLDLRQCAVCLSSVCQTPLTVETVLVALIQHLRPWIEDWQSQTNRWFPYWLDRCLLSGRVIHARTRQIEIVGRCEGIDATGRLLVRDESGVQAINSGEVVRWQT